MCHRAKLIYDSRATELENQLMAAAGISNSLIVWVLFLKKITQSLLLRVKGIEDSEQSWPG